MFKPIPQNGFTLVEMIVAIALFMTVAVVAIGAFLKVVDLNKKSQSLKSAITNLNFALESMAREMRVGTDYYCTSSQFTGSFSIPGPNNCAETGNAWNIAFYSSKLGNNGACHLIYSYYFDKKSLYKAEQPANCSNIDASLYYPVVYGSTDSTDPKLNDESVNFTLGTIKVVTEGPLQPYAQFHFSGYTGVKEKNRSYFDLQTTVSQRLPNN